MMNDVEKMFEAGSGTQELRKEDLEAVSGGSVRVEGYGILMQLITKCKKKGQTKEECIATIRKGWEGDCRFKLGVTDGSDEDLKSIIDYVEKNW